MMPAKLDYHWHLREVMADRGMFQTTDLIGPLEQRGITLSSSQVYRLVVERPERRSSRPRRGQPGERAAGAEAGVGRLQPKRARVRGAELP